MTELLHGGLAVALALAALPVAAPSLYLLFLALLSWPLPAPPPPSPPRFRFDLVVPAHNEAVGISATVKSLLALLYPRELFRVLVVADNCSDETAARAREAGAMVLERRDDTQRGKGYALALAFERSVSEGQADAVVVIDADTVVSPGLLHAFAARLEAGAVAVQAHYGVRNPHASWRTRLMRIALAMFHQVRSVARQRLGVSCGLRGNGMCFRTSLLREVPHRAFSLVEDLEYGIALGRRGHRVVYAFDAEVLGEMVSGEQASMSQRRRWEHGRAQMARQHGWPLLRDGILRRSPLLADLALDVLIPPLSRLVAGGALGLVASVALLLLTGRGSIATALFLASLLGLGGYALAGWLWSHTGLRGLLDLALAPAYVVWKASLWFRQPAAQKPKEWVRTTREGEKGP